MARITRIEVIDENGRHYVNYEDDNDVIYQLQDDGRTLKVFVNTVKPKTPCEIAYKRIYGKYAVTGIAGGSGWTFFQDGYNASKEEEYQPTPQEPSVINCMIEGPPPNGYPSWSEWYNEMGSKGILHNLKISSLGEGKFQPTPQTENEVTEGLRSAFREAQQTEEWKETQRKIEEDNDKNFKNSIDLIEKWGEKNKPKTLYQICMDWWDEVFVNEMDDDICIDVLVSRIDKEFIPPSHDTNGYEWEKCLKMMRKKLR